MDEPYVAPYGGLLTKSLEDQNERESLLQQQAVQISVNGAQETIRPEAIFIRGVDSLSTEDITAFVNYYLNYTVLTSDDGALVYTVLPLQREFRVQWVNDSSVNVVFDTAEDAVAALALISITAQNPNAPQSEAAFALQDNIQERETKPFAPVIHFKKVHDLKSRIGVPAGDAGDAGDTVADAVADAAMDEDDSSVVLHARQSFQSDRKVKNASTYLRYYLLHGEPERRARPRGSRGRDDRNTRRKPRQRLRPGREEEEDLFASRLGQRDAPSPHRDRLRLPVRIEEDLFASKMKR
jgi:hypothetical protein